MNKFEKQLEKWNGGILRGAQAKLAKILQVSTATVALWTTGKRRPSKGYLARMAQLFNMDPLDAIRLFPAQTTYPETHVSHPATLRDAQDVANTYSTDILSTETNSVLIPLLNSIPDTFPQYEDRDVAEWWTLPRRAAMGAKCLVADSEAHAHGKEDLYLIRPTTTAEEGQVMLLRAGGLLQLKRVRIQNGSIILSHLNGTFDKQLLPQDVTFLGTAVQKITNVF